MTVNDGVSPSPGGEEPARPTFKSATGCHFSGNLEISGNSANKGKCPKSGKDQGIRVVGEI